LTVLDTAAGVWLDRNGLVSSSRSNKGRDHDPSLELMRRCRHAAAAVGVQVYIYGGLRGGQYSVLFIMSDEVVMIEIWV
jgi:protein phosphatase